MYRKHFAFIRLPFEIPAETDEVIESSARRKPEARLGHLIELKANSRQLPRGSRIRLVNQQLDRHARIDHEAHQRSSR